MRRNTRKAASTPISRHFNSQAELVNNTDAHIAQSHYLVRLAHAEFFQEFVTGGVALTFVVQFVLLTMQLVRHNGCNNTLNATFKAIVEIENADLQGNMQQD
jgi:hypothetical protein